MSSPGRGFASRYDLETGFQNLINSDGPINIQRHAPHQRAARWVRYFTRRDYSADALTYPLAPKGKLKRIGAIRSRGFAASGWDAIGNGSSGPKESASTGPGQEQAPRGNDPQAGAAVTGWTMRGESRVNASVT